MNSRDEGSLQTKSISLFSVPMSLAGYRLGARSHVVLVTAPLTPVAIAEWALSKLSPFLPKLSPVLLQTVARIEERSNFRFTLATARFRSFFQSHLAEAHPSGI